MDRGANGGIIAMTHVFIMCIYAKLMSQVSITTSLIRSNLDAGAKIMTNKGPYWDLPTVRLSRRQSDHPLSGQFGPTRITLMTVYEVWRYSVSVLTTVT
jgi:hypothetical protein